MGRWTRFLPVFFLMALMATAATVLADDDLQLGSDVVPMFQVIDLKIDADRPDWRIFALRPIWWNCTVE